MIYGGGRPHIARRPSIAGRLIKETGRDGKLAGAREREQSLVGQVLQRTEANITEHSSLIRRLIKSSLCIYDKRVAISSSLPTLRIAPAPRRECYLVTGSSKNTLVLSMTQVQNDWLCEEE